MTLTQTEVMSRSTDRLAGYRLNKRCPAFFSSISLFHARRFSAMVNLAKPCWPPISTMATSRPLRFVNTGPVTADLCGVASFQQAGISGQGGAWANTLRRPETYNDRGLIGFPMPDINIDPFTWQNKRLKDLPNA
jgi:hypothetical protein